MGPTIHPKTFPKEEFPNSFSFYLLNFKLCDSMKKTKVKMKGAHFGILYRWTTHAHTGDFIFVQEETLVNAKVTLILLYFF